MINLSKKNPIVGGILSLFFGPFGYIYHGVYFFLSALIVSVLFSVVLAVINLPYPYFFNYLQMLVYGYYGYKLATIRNLFVDEWGVTEDDIKEFKSFGFSFVIMNNLLMTLVQFYTIIAGLFLAFKSFSNGKIFIGILIIVFGIALIKWLLTLIFGFLSGLLMLLFKVDKKYFE
jgi:hypothetical protein